MNINIAYEFTETPGGRFRDQGEFSGEEFRQRFLKPRYEASINNNEKLTINMDNCYGFAASFLEEAFGGLARDLKDKNIMKNIDIVCNDEPGIIERINGFVANALKTR